jgi:hypothetical protein
MSDNNNDQHIVDYMQFNSEQMKWFDDLDKQRIIEHAEWLEEYLKDFPLKI